MTPHSIPDDQADDVIRLIGFGFTDDGIAHRYGCTRQTVINFRRRHGIAKRRGGYRPRMPGEAATGLERPIRIYYDEALGHIVRVFAPRHCSNDDSKSDLPYEEEAACPDPLIAT